MTRFPKQQNFYLIDYVLQANFIVDGYTDMYVSIKGTRKTSAFENAYFDLTGATVEQLKTLAGERQTLRHDKFQSDLTNAKQEIQRR